MQLELIWSLCIGLQPVELFVLFLGDLTRAAVPNGLHVADLVAVDVDRELVEYAVFLDDLFDFLLTRKLDAVLPEAKDNLCAALKPVDIGDLIVTKTLADPDHTSSVVCLRVDLYFICDDERTVKADAEHSDKVLCRLRAANRLSKFLRAAPGDCAQVLNDLIAGHARSSVLENDDALLLVSGDFDIQLVAWVCLSADLGVAVLLQRIASIRQQLTDEHFFVGVDRLGDDVEQLRRLRLELEALSLTVRDLRLLDYDLCLRIG